LVGWLEEETAQMKFAASQAAEKKEDEGCRGLKMEVKSGRQDSVIRKD
jgi:hypothetical protein